VADNEVLRDLVESDPRQTLEEIADIIGCHYSTVQRHLNEIGKTNRCGIWVPHNLSDQSKGSRVSICNSLLIRQNNEPFLHRIITGDEKWVLYENPKRTRQWLSPGQTPVPTAKPGLHPKKALLSVWWDIHGIIHFEVLEYGQTVTADVYCGQLERLRDALLAKRPALINRKGVILQHDNAKPHTAKLTQQKLRGLGWEVMPHPAYSPDVAPSDFHLFRSLQHFLSGNSFEDIDAIRSALTAFFASKPASFYKQGIEDLVRRWGVVVDNEGEYIID
jgi:histone-lysine N-methyltransferase SETMAR